MARAIETRNHYQLISADSHINEPPDLWTSRVPSPLRERAPRMARLEQGDAWILVCVNDRAGGPAELVVLDGEDLADAPVARVHLPQRVPDGFHGAWVPDSSVAPD